MFGYKVRKREYCYSRDSIKPYKISRSKIDLFVECPRCFYLDQRLGIPRTSFPAFTLNNAVDELLKREFDAYREASKPHPIMEEHGIRAVPLKDPRMEEWRDALRRGVQHLHASTGFIVRGGLDDVWALEDGALVVVDYKATNKKDEVTLDGFWQQSYKRQVEVYQWLLRKNGFTVSPIAYFVYANAKNTSERFDNTLAFDTTLLSHEGSDAWIEPTLGNIQECLDRDLIPPVGEHCEYCPYREEAGKALFKLHQASKKQKETNVGIDTKTLF